MNKSFNVPRGTSDILPDASPLWEELESQARKICKSYGYREIRTPVYEETDLFKRSLGQTSDVVNKQLLELAAPPATSNEAIQEAIYRVSKEATSSYSGYALRPEGTASVVRSYLENSFDKKESLSKFFYIAPMFRGERPQKGRLRQFHQIGVEAIGPNSTSPYLDAEIIALAMHLLDRFGVKGLKLKVNSLGTEEDKKKFASRLREELRVYKSQLCEECQNRFERNIFRVLDCKNEKCKQFMPPTDRALELTQSQESKDYFQQVLACLFNLGLKPEISHTLVRGLDYYTHTVFEITAEGLGSQDAVGAGGRYDGLIHELGGNEKIKFGAIGFALGIERILIASGAIKGEPAANEVFVIPLDGDQQKKAFKLLMDLRNAGITADMVYTGGSLKSQLNRANKLNAQYALILGSDEEKNNLISVRDMKQSVQIIKGFDEVIEYLKENLKR